MKKRKRDNFKMLRNLTEREEKKKLSGRDDIGPNSFLALNMFVKTEVFDVHE